MRRSRRVAAALAAALAAAAALAGASPAAASSTTFRVSVTYYGAAVAGGAGLLVYLSASWEAFAGSEAPATALLEVGGGRVRAGLPLPRAAGWGNAGREGDDRSVGIDFLRIRF